jgi:malonyl-CoA/methylmalonyl-CoA synthetase
VQADRQPFPEPAWRDAGNLAMTVDDTFLSALRASMLDHRARVAWRFQRRPWTYGELERHAERAARLLHAHGVAPGDRVVLYLEDKEAFLLAHLGALWCGAVPVPLHPGIKPDALAFRLADSGARLIVADEAARQVIRSLTTKPAVLDAAAVADPPPLAPIAPHDPKPDDPALLLYSSGTTGQPKGVLHTQANLLAAVRAIAGGWRFTADDVLVNALPLFHIHGLSFASHVSMLAGSCMQVLARFHPVRILDAIEQSSVFMGVPPFYYALLKRPEFAERAASWHRLRLVTCGSAPIRPDVLPELQRLLGRPIINRYGMTECHVLTSLPLDGPWPAGSVGCPIDGIELAVRDERGTTCPPGIVGQVYSRGPNLFREYWNRPGATRDAFRDGWFATGDLGKTDPAGFLELAGRLGDLIIVGGFNVYPAVVERVLLECPGVRDAAVVGVPDPQRGERVAAFVMADESQVTVRAIHAHCHAKLVDYECPQIIRIVAELPRNDLGKVAKREL